MYDEMIDELRGELLDLSESTRNIQAAADADKRELTEDEENEIASLMDQFERKEAEIERRERMQAQVNSLKESFGPTTEPQNPEPQAAAEPTRRQSNRQPRIEVMEDRGKWGWKSFGEFAKAVKNAARPAGGMDPRLISNAQPTTYGSEGVGEDGGYAVPPDFRTEIMQKVIGEESLLARTDQFTTMSNQIVFPADETAPWDSSNGIQVAWGSENGQYAESKPQLKEKQVRLHKLTCLVPVTEELQEDAPALDGYLRREVSRRMDFAIQDAIINGSGAGQPVGILNASCLVTQAKDTSTSPNQPADTVRFRNIIDMWNRLYAPCRSRAVWLVHYDVEPQLQLAEFSPGSSTPVPVYMPANGVSGSPYSTLMGRPVIPVQGCQQLGNAGDIILGDLTQYLSVMKTGGLRSDVSIHLYFDYGATAYRFSMRLAGMPWWGSTISDKNGSTTRSCFVTLAERA